MESTEPSRQIPDEESSFSIPRGGPILLPDLVSPLTRTSLFESDVFHELESLKAELGNEPTDFEDQDISVDELKLFSDEELVSEAMKIAFEGDEDAGTSSDLTENICSSGADDDHSMVDLDPTALSGFSNDFSSETTHDGVEKNANFKKRMRRSKVKGKSKNRKTRKMIVAEQHKQIDETYLAKVEHLVKIRHKQEEDAASVKLHAFNHKEENSAALSSGSIETLKFVELFSSAVKGKCSMTGNFVPIQYPEVVLCVEIYHNKQTWKKTQELLVLGSQVLTELRDKIHCLMDVIMQKAGKYDPSGYFLIEDVFCKDMRDPSAIDYSEPIFDWLQNSKEQALAKWDYILSGVGKAKSQKVLPGEKPVSKLPNFRAVEMQRTRFCDLGFRLGAGYLYCHQGDCKHMIVIRDMRLIHPEDVQNQAAYPLPVYKLKPILKKCYVCGIYKATKVTVDDKLAGENPCYFCDNCYYLLHYSEDGTLIYNRFTVYDYVEDY